MTKDKHTFPNYGHPELEFARGEGVRLFTANGDDYIDFGSGIAVNSLGHAHPHLVEALKTQAEKLWHTSNLYKIEGSERLAKRLCENSFADSVFFTNSGVEALECAIKTARRYHYAQGNKKRVNIITIEGAFHGRTLGTIAAGGTEKYLEGFGPVVPGFIQVPFGDHDALKAAVDDETAAILLEPIQGEGGIREIPAHCLKDLREFCDDEGILLIYDEVQTGIGRTGKLFAYEWASNKAGDANEGAPHIMALAKGLGGGFPIGACLAQKHIADVMVVGTHGSTFAGNPLAMAVGNAVLDIILDEGFLESVRANGLVLGQMMAEICDTYPDFFELVRGKGMLLGIKAKIPNAEIFAALKDAGILTVPAGDNIIRVLPPLIVTPEELSEAKARMTNGLDKLVEEKKKS